MATFRCPWCAEDSALDLAAFGEEELVISCPDCGTTVSFVREPAPEVELVA